LKEIQTPLIVATGDEDIGFPLFCAEELVENIPHAELYIFQGQAHMIPDERPQEFLELIKDFFQ
jgi:pimeloyl-ACP methyl ester carboxylesterase